MGVLKDDIKKVLNENLPYEHLNNQSFLLTGCTGLIMTCFVHVLMELNKKGANIKAYCLCRSEEKVNENYSDILNDPFLNVIYADVLDMESIEADIDYIVHAASPTNQLFFLEHPSETLKININGTENMLEIAKKKSVKGFLYISSVVVYGKNNGQKMAEDFCGEIDFLNIKSCYANGKRIGELLCTSYLKEYNVPVYIIRPSSVYGPHTSLDSRTSFSDFMRNTVMGENIILKSEGKAIRSYIYVTDAVTAMFTVLLKGEIGEVYNVTNSEEELSIFELANIFAENSNGESKVLFEIAKDEYLKPLADVYVTDTAKLEKLGWHASVNIREGVKRTISGYKEKCVGSS